MGTIASEQRPGTIPARAHNAQVIGKWNVSMAIFAASGLLAWPVMNMAAVTQIF